MRFFIGFLACAVAFWIECFAPEVSVRVDEAIRDSFLQFGADEAPETRLTVIDISESALAEIGPWPWSRGQMADLAEIVLDDYAAKAMAFDVVFPEPADAVSDGRLASLAGFAQLTLAQVLDLTPSNQSIAQGKLLGGQSSFEVERLPRAYGYIANHLGFSASRCIGNIGYAPDGDGVLRRIPLFAGYQEKAFPHLAVALLKCASTDALSWQSFKGSSNSPFWRIPYRYSPTSYTVISAAEVLSERAPGDLLAGRYVLVGSSALGLGDRVSTPLSSLSAGVMVHAASLSGLLDIAEGHARMPWSARALILGWTVVSVVAAVFLVTRLSAWSSLLVLLFLMLIWVVLAYIGVAFQAEGSISAPLSALLILLFVAIPHEWRRSQRDATRLLNTFSHYVAKPVLDELLRAGATHSLTPTLREVTVLIADMEGYTPMTSSLSLDEAATLTKDFLDCLTRPVLEKRGTLDKYTGDGLVAFWGAPLACPDQADRAVSAALAILDEVDAFNAQRHERGERPIRVRIGIESGKALVGDLGTPFRSTYTAVGDCINFASRLEAAARDLPAQVVIGAVANSLLVQHSTIALGRHVLRGTSTEIDLFTVERTTIDDSFPET